MTNRFNLTQIVISTGTKTTIPIAGCSKISVHPLGYVFVSASTSVYIYNIKTATLLPSIALTGGTIASVNALCVDLNFNVYVGVTIGSNSYYIYKYTCVIASGTATLTYVNSLAPSGSAVVNAIAYQNNTLYYTNKYAIYSYKVLTSGVVWGTASGSGISSTIVVGLDNIQGTPVDGAYPSTTALNNPVALSFDINGVMYIVDNYTSILKVSTYTPLQTGLTYTMAGTNATGLTTEGVKAYSELFMSIKGVCYDTLGNLYISDISQHTVSVMTVSGVVSTFAGTRGGAGRGYSGDGGQATSARLYTPSDIKMNGENILYIADTGNNVIRRVKPYSDGTNHIETYFSIASPTSIAIDTYGNLYVVSGGTNIQKISTMGQNTNIITLGQPIGIIALDSMNTLYYTTGGNVYKIAASVSILIISGLTTPSGLVIDSYNNLYVSDSAMNIVYTKNLNLSMPSQNITALGSYIGNGLTEPVFTNSTEVPMSIYGNGGPPTKRALTAPGALVVNPLRGLIVAQPTKITLLASQSALAPLPSCANTISQISIRNNGSTMLYLSQLVALNNAGVNVLLKSSTASYVNGFYGCKSYMNAFPIPPNTTLLVPMTTPDDIVVLMIYPSSTQKTNWNGASIRTTPTASSNNTVMTVTISANDPYVTKFIVDYRTKSAACSPYINYVNKYKLQTANTSPVDTYREQWARYVRILRTAGQLILTQVHIIHAETGVDLALNLIPSVSLNVKKSADTLYGDAVGLRNSTLAALTTANNTTLISFPSSPYKPGITNSDVWLEYDLGDEYPIEQVILNGILSSYVKSYTTNLYTNNRASVQIPTTYSQLDNAVAYIRVQGSSYGTPTLPTYTYSGGPAPTSMPTTYTTINMPQIVNKPLYYTTTYIGSLTHRAPNVYPPTNSTVASSIFANVISVGLNSTGDLYVGDGAELGWVESLNVVRKIAPSLSAAIPTTASMPAATLIGIWIGATGIPVTSVSVVNGIVYFLSPSGDGYTKIVDIYGNAYYTHANYTASQTTNLFTGISDTGVWNNTTRGGYILSLTGDRIGTISGASIPTGSVQITAITSVSDGNPLYMAQYTSGANTTTVMVDSYGVGKYYTTTNGGGISTYNPTTSDPISYGTYSTVALTLNLKPTFRSDIRAAFGLNTAPLNVSLVSKTINWPHGMTFDSADNLYVTHFTSKRIEKITPSSMSSSQYVPSTITTSPASLNFYPLGIAINQATNNMYIADYGNHRIWYLPLGGTTITVLAGSTQAAGVWGYANGNGTAALFSTPMAIDLSPDASKLYIADFTNNMIRVMSTTSPYAVTTFAYINNPMGIRVNRVSGNIYVAARESTNIIYKITPTGTVSIIAGTGGAGFNNGIGINAQFNMPMSLTVSYDETVCYVADYANYCVRKIDLTTTAATTAIYYEYPLSSPTTTTSITVNTTVSSTVPHMLIAYNQAKEEIARGGITNTTYTLQIPTTTTLACSFSPIVGTRRVRYIRLQNGDGSGNTTIQISQLLAFDSNRINVSYGKTATASTNALTANLPVSGSDATPFSTSLYWEVDLGQEYEITQVVYVKPSAVISTGSQIILMDSFRIQQGVYTLDVSQTIQSLDFRYVGPASMKYVPLLTVSATDKSLYVSDKTVSNCVRGRYVRLENSTPTSTFSVNTPAIYDTYGKNIVNGKTITAPVSSDYGTTWEIDLGQEYSIRDIVYSGVTVSIAIYNRLRAEMWRNYITSAITAPFPIQTPSNALTYSLIRFIRVQGNTTANTTVNHVSVIDSRGIDVAVWKPVRVVSGTTVTFNTFNGLYTSGIVVTTGTKDWLEIDLGGTYHVASITAYYSTGSAPIIKTYDERGAQVLGVASYSTMSSPSPIQRYANYGTKARYIGVTIAAFFNIAVIDALGRNVAANKSVKDFTSAKTSPLSNIYTKTITALAADGSTSTYFELDLGEEHTVSYIVVYPCCSTDTFTTTTTAFGFWTAIAGKQITMMDSCYNITASRTLAGTGGQVSITYNTSSAPSQPAYLTPQSPLVTVSGTTWTFPINEHVVATVNNAISSTIYGMAVNSAGIIYYTTDTQLIRIGASNTTTVLWNGSGFRGITLSLDELTLYMCVGNTIASFVISSSTFTVISGGGTASGGGTNGAGSGVGLNNVDGNITRTPTQCTYNNPTAIVFSPAGTNANPVLYIADTGNHLIRQLIYNGAWTVSTYAGATTCTGFAGEDGGSRYGIPDWGSCAEGRWRSGYDWGAGGRWCTVDTNYRIINIAAGATNGSTGTSSSFNSPTGLAIDMYDNLYVADKSNSVIRKIAAGGGAVSNFSSGLGFQPENVALDSNNTVYVSGSQYQGIKRITSDGSMTDIATGNLPTGSSADGWIDKSAPSDITTWTWPTIAINGAVNINYTVPAATQATIGYGYAISFPKTSTTAFGPTTATGSGTGAMYFGENVGSTWKIRQFYYSTTRTATCTATTSATGGNMFQVGSSYYTIPDIPFIGPFTGSNAASALIGGNTFSGASYIELLDFIQPTPITGLYIRSTTTTDIVIGWLGGGDYSLTYTYTLNGVISTPSSTTTGSISTATFTGLTPNTTLYVIGISASNSNGSSQPALITSYPSPSPPVMTPANVLNVSSTSITISWTGGNFASSYTYTLNALAAIPVIDNGVNGKTATFTGLTGNTGYIIGIIAKNDSYNTGVSLQSPMSITTAPSNPVLSFSSSGILTWSGGTGATSYTILRNEIDATSSATIDIGNKKATFNDLVGNTTYTFILTAINSSTSVFGSIITTSSDSVALTATTGPPVPSLSYTQSYTSATNTSTAAISWTGGDGATSYMFTQILMSGANSIYPNNFGIISGSGIGATGTVTATALALPPSGTGVPVYLAQDGTIVRFWSSSGTTGYYTGLISDFRYDFYAMSSATTPYSITSYTISGAITPPSNSTITQAVGNGTSITITNLQALSFYTFVVTAINGNGQVPSVPLNITTGGAAPTALTNLTSSNLSASGFNVSFSGGSNTFTYSYTLSPAVGTSAMSVVNNVAIFTGITTSMTAETVYTVNITATNTIGSTTASIVVTIPKITVTAVIIGNQQGGSGGVYAFTVSWTGGTGATSYAYILNGGTQTTFTPSGTSYTITGLSAGTSYSVIIVINPGSIQSNGGVAQTFWTLPVAPNNLASSNVTSTGFNISWTPQNGAVSYDYVISPSVQATFTYNMSGTGIITGLNSNTSYTFNIRAINSGGKSSSNLISLITPLPPINITFQSATQTSITFSWTGGTGGTISVVYNGITINTPTSPLTITALTVGTSYTFTVASTSSLSSSANVSSTIVSMTLPSNPNISLYTFTSTGCVLVLTGGQGATTWNFTANGIAIVPTLSPASNPTSATFTGLVPGAQYTITGTVSNSSGFAPNTATTTVNLPPNTPSISSSSISAISSSSFIISWTACAGAAIYTIVYGYGAIVVGAWGTTSTVTTATTYQISSLIQNTLYSVIVYSTSSYGINSFVSATVSVLTAPGIPFNLTVTSFFQTRIDLSWACNGGTTSPVTYSFTITPTVSIASVTTSTNGSGTSITGLTAGTSYSIQITATNANGLASSASTPLTFLTLPGNFTGPTVSSITQTSFVVNWGGCAGATNYNYSLTTAGVTTLTVLSGTGQSATIPGTPGSTYTLALQAMNVSGIINSSNVTVYTLCAPPTGVSVSPFFFGFNFLGYYIFFSYSFGATSYNLIMNGTTTTGINKDPMYDAYLVGVNTAGYSTSSPFFSFYIDAVNAAGATSRSSQVIGYQPAGAFDVIKSGGELDPKIYVTPSKFAVSYKMFRTDNMTQIKSTLNGPITQNSQGSDWSWQSLPNRGVWIRVIAYNMNGDPTIGVPDQYVNITFF